MGGGFGIGIMEIAIVAGVLGFLAIGFIATRMTSRPEE